MKNLKKNSVSKLAVFGGVFLLSASLGLSAAHADKVGYSPEQSNKVAYTPVKVEKAPGTGASQSSPQKQGSSTGQQPSQNPRGKPTDGGKKILNLQPAPTGTSGRGQAHQSN